MFRKIHSDEEQLSREQLEADFSAAYTAHGGEILKYLLSSGMQTADAQDVLQNSFLAMWELRFRIEDTKNLAPLWFTIARHKMFDLFRSSRRRWFPFTGEEQNIPAPEGGMREQDQQYLRRRITAALAGLPEEMAEAYRLTKIGGLSIREAAEILKLSESDVKSKVFRARKKLMEELKDLRDFQFEQRRSGQHLEDAWQRFVEMRGAGWRTGDHGREGEARGSAGTWQVSVAGRAPGSVSEEVDG